MGALPPRWGDRSLTVIITVKFLLTGMRKKPSNTKSRLLLLSVKAKWMKGQVCKAAHVTGETAPYGRQNLHPSRHRAAAAPCLSQGATLRAALSSGNWSGRESASLQPVRRNRQRRGKAGPRDSSAGARLWGAAAPASTSQADKARWSVSSPQKSQDCLPLYRADPFPSATRRLSHFYPECRSRVFPAAAPGPPRTPGRSRLSLPGQLCGNGRPSFQAGCSPLPTCRAPTPSRGHPAQTPGHDSCHHPARWVQSNLTAPSPTSSLRGPLPNPNAS